jgi:hypothetical protein
LAEISQQILHFRSTSSTSIAKLGQLGDLDFESQFVHDAPFIFTESEPFTIASGGPNTEFGANSIVVCPDDACQSGLRSLLLFVAPPAQGGEHRRRLLMAETP